MLFRIQVMLQRKLHHRDIGLGQSNLERDEDTVVIAPLAVFAGRDAGALEQVAHPLRQRRRAGRIEPKLVGMRRKVGVIIDQRRFWR